MKRKVRKRKNPRNKQDLLNTLQNDSNIKIGYLSAGNEGDVYGLVIPKRTIILDFLLLNKGKYVLKIYDYGIFLNSEQIEYLTTLSKYGLIPKIYYIDDKIIIMDYIDGIKYYYFETKYRGTEELDIVKLNINKLKKIWKRLGFEHGDLNDANILVTNDLKVYFIDPSISHLNYEN